MTKRSVFLSSRARDTAAAAKLAMALDQIGFETFNASTDVLPGADLRKSIQTAMRRSDMVLLMMSSPDDGLSSWMQYEAGMADALGKMVLTLVPDRFSMSQLPLDMLGQRVVQWDPNSPDLAAKLVARAMSIEPFPAHAR
jgi:TIR domain